MKLQRAFDFSGNYFASQATFKVAGGDGGLVMVNGKRAFVAL
jgi:hypothetical protein